MLAVQHTMVLKRRQCALTSALVLPDQCINGVLAYGASCSAISSDKVIGHRGTRPRLHSAETVCRHLPGAPGPAHHSIAERRSCDADQSMASGHQAHIRTHKICAHLHDHAKARNLRSVDLQQPGGQPPARPEGGDGLERRQRRRQISATQKLPSEPSATPSGKLRVRVAPVAAVLSISTLGR